ncbi:MAG: hypothetical protein SFU99_10855 [Saprospiraceae bacterium]|nr:hypothetical protein [Saprospiraceae bacterium]
MRIIKNLLWLLLLLPISAFSQNALVGEWKFEVPSEDGKMIPVKLKIDTESYTVDFGMDGAIDIKGNYTVAGNEMTIQDTGGEGACLNTKGVYKFEIKDNSLTMTKVTDTCEGRSGPEGKMVFQKM